MEKKQAIKEAPISVVRYECINKICNILNESKLPVFVKVDFLERILNELRPQVDIEYQRDKANYESSKKQEV